MLNQELKDIFNRDLNHLKKEIASYQNEKNLWIINDNISNSAGNLCLHLVGNLKWFVGAQLGNSGYVRNREFEFSAKNVPRSELLKEIDETISIVTASLDSMSSAALDDVYPIEVFKKPMSSRFFLIHLSTHLSYHLGQINYHRRIFDR
ncbi:MAG: DUF1572 family protein [Crocinitomicaceae bacterium]